MEKNSKVLWEKEYEVKGLPTSYKKSLSRGLEFFSQYLAKNNIKLGGPALDLGCGNGRNGLYIARQGIHVYGLDISQTALNQFKHDANKEKLGERVTLLRQSMDKKYPVPQGSIEIILSLTSINNMISDAQLEFVKKEMLRVLKPHGYLLLYFLTTKDGVYGPLVKKSASSEKGVVLSPDTGMRLRMFSKEQLEEYFSGSLKAIDSKEFAFEDTAYGKTYQRNLAAIIFKKEG